MPAMSAEYCKVDMPMHEPYPARAAYNPYNAIMQSRMLGPQPVEGAKHDPGTCTTQQTAHKKYAQHKLT